MVAVSIVGRMPTGAPKCDVDPWLSRSSEHGGVLSSVGTLQVTNQIASYANRGFWVPSIFWIPTFPKETTF